MEYSGKNKRPTTRSKREARRKVAREHINRREEGHRQRAKGGGQPGALGMHQGQSGEQGPTKSVPLVPHAETGAGE
jgi:hypothetical protein